MARKTDRKKTPFGKRKASKRTSTEKGEEITLQEVALLIRNKWFHLLVIIAISLFFRVYSFRYSYFIGADTAVHYSVLKESISLGYVPDISPLSNYPDGGVVSSPKTLYYMAMLFGINLFPMLSVLFFIPTVILFFLVTRRFGDKISLLATVLISISVGNVYRTQANLFRGDSFFYLFFLLALYIMLKENKRLLHWVLIGTISGLSSFFWSGYPILIFFVVACFFFNSAYNFFIRNRRIRTYPYFGAYLLLASLIVIFGVVTGLGGTTNTNNLFLISVYPLICVSAFSLVSLLEILPANNKSKIVLIVILITAVLSLVIFSPSTFRDIITGYGLINPQIGLQRAISELRSPSLTDFFDLYGVTIFLLPFGALLFILNYKKWDEKNVYFFSWFMISVFLMLSSRRFLYHASYVISFFAAVSLISIADYIAELKQVGKYRRQLAYGVLALVVISSAVFSYTKIEIFQPYMDEFWEESLLWLKQNSQPYEAVMTYWDYGGFVQMFAERPTVTDSVYGQVKSKIAEFDSFLVNGIEFVSHDSEYLIVDKLLFFRLPWHNISYIRFDEIEIQEEPSETIRFNDFESGTVVEVYPQLAPNVGFIVSGDQRIPFKKTFVQIEEQVFEIRAFDNVTSFSGCFYYSFDIPLWVDNNLCESNYFKLAYGTGLEGFLPVYRNAELTIYEVT